MFSLETKKVVITIALATVADPAAAYALSIADASGKTTVDVSISAVVDRTADVLAGAVSAAIPAKYAAVVKVDGTSIQLTSIGGSTVTFSGANAASASAVVTDDTVAHTTDMILSGIGGVFVGKTMFCQQSTT
jgi:hypothetical protein